MELEVIDVDGKSTHSFIGRELGLELEDRGLGIVEDNKYYKGKKREEALAE